MTAAFGAPEMMAVAMARLIRDHETVFVGVNSPLPLVAAALAVRMHAKHATLITIAGGINPELSHLSAATTDPGLARGSASVFDNPDLYDLVARGGVDLTFLGVAQADKFANLNSSVVGSHSSPTVRFPGGGGAAYILPLAGRTVVWRAAHDRRIFVERCDFVTAAGNVDRIVTPRCVFRRQGGQLVLESVHPYVSKDELQAHTGFMIERLGEAVTTTAPTDQELAQLEAVDPTNVRSSEFDAHDLALAGWRSATTLP